MKSYLKRLMAHAVNNDLIWTVLDCTVLRITRYIEWARQTTHATQITPPSSAMEAIMRQIFPDLTVRHGVFQGMQYPVAEASGSALFPKLIGSYERELHPVIETICRTAYTEIVDIGCAEGYYAVGLALRIPSATVFAYDTNQYALQLCQRMAELNHVRERLRTGALCDAGTLRKIPFTRKGLIISDCEGYEKELFTAETIPFLSRHDLLIEVHDYLDIELSTVIREHFESTHDMQVIQSIDDLQKAHTYMYAELENYDLQTRKTLLAECRPAIMEWFYLTSRIA